jgi:hypothetical protein
MDADLLDYVKAFDEIIAQTDQASR